MPPVWLDLKRRGLIKPDALLSAYQMLAPPVPIRFLLAHLGVFVHDIATPGWNGATHSNAQRADIWVREDLDGPAKNWVLAHELGHLMCEGTGTMWTDVHFTGATPAEQRADAFAADLLTPMWMIHPYYFLPGANTEAIANLFQVPPTLVDQRGRQVLGLP